MLLLADPTAPAPTWQLSWGAAEGPEGSAVSSGASPRGDGEGGPRGKVRPDTAPALSRSLYALACSLACSLALQDSVLSSESFVKGQGAFGRREGWHGAAQPSGSVPCLEQDADQGRSLAHAPELRPCKAEARASEPDSLFLQIVGRRSFGTLHWPRTGPQFLSVWFWETSPGSRELGGGDQAHSQELGDKAHTRSTGAEARLWGGS